MRRSALARSPARKLAGVDFFAFQRALGERRIPLCTEEMLTEDVATLQRLFPM
ncbi:MAG TPA: hypothetical protein VGR14_06525 [Verrucomicrobiae bacterium]|jgi:hypothetical protein|nr:hypothetical protein [Verrucomicrobiae bacterium]